MMVMGRNNGWPRVVCMCKRQDCDYKPKQNMPFTHLSHEDGIDDTIAAFFMSPPHFVKLPFLQIISSSL